MYLHRTSKKPQFLARNIVYRSYPTNKSGLFFLHTVNYHSRLQFPTVLIKNPSIVRRQLNYSDTLLYLYKFIIILIAHCCRMSSMALAISVSGRSGKQVNARMHLCAVLSFQYGVVNPIFFGIGHSVPCKFLSLQILFLANSIS